MVFLLRHPSGQICSNEQLFFRRPRRSWLPTSLFASLPRVLPSRFLSQKRDYSQSNLIADEDLNQAYNSEHFLSTCNAALWIRWPTIAHFRVDLSLSYKARNGAQPHSNHLLLWIISCGRKKKLCTALGQHERQLPRKKGTGFKQYYEN